MEGGGLERRDAAGKLRGFGVLAIGKGADRNPPEDAVKVGKQPGKAAPVAVKGGERLEDVVFPAAGQRPREGERLPVSPLDGGILEEGAAPAEVSVPIKEGLPPLLRAGRGKMRRDPFLRLGGRHREELDAGAAGKDGFRDHPLVICGQEEDGVGRRLLEHL